MNVIVDTPIWSLALRRTTGAEAHEVEILSELIKDGRAMLIGLVRQELLSGIKTTKQFENLREHLAAFPDVPLETADYEQAAAFFNQCRSKGVQGSSIDFLICAVAHRRGLEIFTTDGDFTSCAKHLPIKRHQSRTQRRSG